MIVVKNETINKFQTQPIQKAKGLPLLGQTFSVLKDPLKLLLLLKQEYKDSVKLRFGLKDYYLLQTPQAAKHVMQENARNYYKPGAAKLMKRMLGEGLATSNGDLWLKQRRLIQPAFHKHRLDDFFKTIHNETSLLIKDWKQKKEWEEVDVSKAFLKLTLNNISKAMFGTGVDDKIDEIGSLLRTMIDFSSDATKSLIKIPLSIPTRNNIEFKNAEKRFEKVIYHLIEQRRKEKIQGAPAKNDLLEMLISAYDDESCTYMTEQQLRDEITTIFMAGHETTSQTLSWIFYHLALHPEINGRLKAEANLIDDSVDSLAKLSYTKAVIEETMRFYPPVWIIARKSWADDIINEKKLPGGSTILINVYGMHHDPEYWDRPGEFNPEHFSKENKEQLPPYLYLPFGGGARLCIGHHFAMMVMQTVVSRLVQHFDFRIPEGFLPAIDPNLTLRSKEGIKLLIRKSSFYGSN